MTPQELAAQDPKLASLFRPTLHTKLLGELRLQQRDGKLIEWLDLKPQSVTKIVERTQYAQGPYTFTAWVLETDIDLIVGVLEAKDIPSAGASDTEAAVTAWFSDRQAAVEKSLGVEAPPTAIDEPAPPPEAAGSYNAKDDKLPPRKPAVQVPRRHSATLS